jgi:hypothetical protein
MKDTYYVIFNRNGIDRWCKERFTLKQGEYAQRVELIVDDLLFSPLQVPTVTLHVSALGVARVVEAEVEGEGEPSDIDLSARLQ